MARTFFSDIDLSQNKLINPVLDQLFAADRPKLGQFWFANRIGYPVYYDGSEVKPFHDNRVKSITSLSSAIVVDDSDIEHIKLALAPISDKDLSSKAAIAFSKLAAPTDVFSFNNQRLTKLAPPISGNDATNKTYVDTCLLDLKNKNIAKNAGIEYSKLASPVADFSFNNQHLIDLAPPVAPNDAATKAYVDSHSFNAGGVRQYSQNLGNGQTRSFIVNHKLGVKDVLVEVTRNQAPYEQVEVLVSRASNDTVIVNFNRPPKDAEFRVTVIGGTIAAPAINPNYYAQTVGDGRNKLFTVTHNLGLKDVVVQVYRNSVPYDSVETLVSRITNKEVTVSFNRPPKNAEFRVVVYRGVTGVPSTTNTDSVYTGREVSFRLGDGVNFNFIVAHNLDTDSPSVEGYYQGMTIDGLDYRVLNNNEIEIRAALGDSPIEPRSLLVFIKN